MAKKSQAPARRELILRAPITDRCVNEIYPLLEAAHSECSYNVGRLSEPKLKRFIAQTLQEGLTFLAFLDDELVGSLAFVVTSPHWSEDEYLINVWLYLTPEARATSKLGLKLIKLAKITAQASHLPLNLDMNSGVDVESKGRLFELFGFVKVGASYRYGR